MFFMERGSMRKFKILITILIMLIISACQVDERIDQVPLETMEELQYLLKDGQLYFFHLEQWIYAFEIQSYFDEEFQIKSVLKDENNQIFIVDFENEILDTSRVFMFHEVNYLDAKGSLFQIQYIFHGNEPDPVTGPSKVGHIFIAWDINTSTVTESINITPLFEIRSYKVYFHDQNNNLIDTLIVNFGESLEDIEPLFLEGFVFQGWRDQFQRLSIEDPIIRDMYFYPVFERERITIFDTGLVQALRDNGVSISMDGSFFKEDALNLKRLDAQEYFIRSLNGLEYFKNLEFIDIRGNFVQTLEPLIELEFLSVVKTANNRLNDSLLYISDHKTYVEELIAKGVQVHNYLYQQVSKTLKNEDNTSVTWKLLVVIVDEVDVTYEGVKVVSGWEETEIEQAIKNVEIFYHAINHLAPDHVYIKVETVLTEEVHRGEISTIQLENGPTFWLWIEQLSELSEMIDEYYSVIVLHRIKDNEGYAGLGFYKQELKIGTASIRYEIFSDIENIFFSTPRMDYKDKVFNNFMSWGTLVLIHEFLHGLEFYGIHGLNLNIWDLHESAYYYEDLIETDYDIFNFDRSLTRDYLWYLGYLRGDTNPNNPFETAIIDKIWENPPK